MLMNSCACGRKLAAARASSGGGAHEAARESERMTITPYCSVLCDACV